MSSPSMETSNNLMNSTSEQKKDNKNSIGSTTSASDKKSENKGVTIYRDIFSAIKRKESPTSSDISSMEPTTKLRGVLSTNASTTSLGIPKNRILSSSNGARQLEQANLRSSFKPPRKLKQEPASDLSQIATPLSMSGMQGGLPVSRPSSPMIAQTIVASQKSTLSLGTQDVENPIQQDDSQHSSSGSFSLSQMTQRAGSLMGLVRNSTASCSMTSTANGHMGISSGLSTGILTQVESKAPMSSSSASASSSPATRPQSSGTPYSTDNEVDNLWRVVFGNGGPQFNRLSPDQCKTLLMRFQQWLETCVLQEILQEDFSNPQEVLHQAWRNPSRLERVSEGDSDTEIADWDQEEDE